MSPTAVRAAFFPSTYKGASRFIVGSARTQLRPTTWKTPYAFWVSERGNPWAATLTRPAPSLKDQADDTSIMPPACGCELQNRSPHVLDSKQSPGTFCKCR